MKDMIVSQDVYDAYVDLHRKTMEAFWSSTPAMRELERQRRVKEVLAKPPGQRF